MSIGMFIAGTDTNVGKTLITASIAWKLSQKFKVSVMKPFATGENYFSNKFKSEDLSILYKSVSSKEDPDILNPCFYKLAASPYMAYKLMGSSPPNINLIKKNLRYLLNKYDIVLVEGIGGLMVPIKHDYLLLNFIKEICMNVLIVSTPMLGTINHTLMSVTMCKNNAIPINGIIINKMPTKPSLVEINTPAFISELSNTPIVGVVPYMEYSNINKSILKRISEFIELKSIIKKY